MKQINFLKFTNNSKTASINLIHKLPTHYF